MTLSETTKNLQEFMQRIPNPENIPNNEINSRYQIFIDTLTDHNHLYYIDAKPIISDLEYDELFAYLKKIEDYYPSIISSNSPTQGLIGQLSDGFKKAKHEIPLISLENSYDEKDIRERAERISKIAEKQGKYDWEYLLEPKFDGLSVEIIYDEGKLSQAITRGDGKIGEDITKNIIMIQQLPKQINYNKKISFRGEVLMPKSQLIKLNEQREKEGQPLFSNTRNAAAGSLKLLNSGEVSKRGLTISIYEQLFGEQQDWEKLGLPIFNLPTKYRIAKNIEQIISRCLDPQLKRFLDEQDIDFDGLVIKVRDSQKRQEEQKCPGLFEQTNNRIGKDIPIREILGSTEHHPRRAIAYKFPAQQIASKILSINFQVGRTGIITPVANIEPVKLGGATISRVTLHNFDFIKNKGIKDKDYVRVQRSGEVIPYIIGPIKERRTGEEEIIVPPLFCPICNKPITNIDIHYYCTNPQCPAQIKEKIIHYASRDAMDIVGMGESIVDILVDQKILTSLDDIYKLPNIENQILLRKFPNFGEKKISELVEQIEQSKKQPLRRLLNALGLPNVGKKIAQDLENYLTDKKVESLDMMIAELSSEDLSNIYGIGEKTIEGIKLFITSPETLELLKNLEKSGLNFSTEKKETQNNKGSFSITGSFTIPRPEIIKQLEKQGYKFHENPTKDTEFILIGEKPGNKAEKAKGYGIKIYDNRFKIKQTFGIYEGNENKPKILQGGLF